MTTAEDLAAIEAHYQAQQAELDALYKTAWTQAAGRGARWKVTRTYHEACAALKAARANEHEIVAAAHEE